MGLSIRFQLPNMCSYRSFPLFFFYLREPLPLQPMPWNEVTHDFVVYNFILLDVHAHERLLLSVYALIRNICLVDCCYMLENTQTACHSYQMCFICVLFFIPELN